MTAFNSNENGLFCTHPLSVAPLYWWKERGKQEALIWMKNSHFNRTRQYRFWPPLPSKLWNFFALKWKGAFFLWNFENLERKINDHHLKDEKNSVLVDILLENLIEQGKKVCKTTAVQCWHCFSERLLLLFALRANWLKKSPWSYSGELLTAADRCKNCLALTGWSSWYDGNGCWKSAVVPYLKSSLL